MTKSQIIREIQRTAKENGGKPLGARKFHTATDIKEHDWRGKYWARWGDALLEAGYAPNQWVQPFSDDLLLEKYVLLTRELGRVPVVSEWKIKMRSDNAYPSYGALIRCFGAWKKIPEQALQYAKKNEIYRDVIPLISATVNSAPEPIEPATQKVITGFVYLMKSGRHYKIGRTNSVGRREWELGIKIPIPPKAIHAIETDDPAGVESYWHRRFSEKRGEGEWFDLSPEDIKAFKRWKRIV